jgi:hypothetical protein
LPSVPATTPGVAHILGDVDPLDKAPTSKQEGFALPVAKRGQAWQKVIADMRPLTKLFNIIKGRATHHKFVRTGQLRAGMSLNDADAGNVYTGTTGVTAAQIGGPIVALLGGSNGVATGELWVTYQCELVNPSLSDDAQEAHPGQWAAFCFRSTVAAFPSPKNIFNEDSFARSAGPLADQISFGGPDSNEIYVTKPGVYLVSLRLAGAAMTFNSRLISDMIGANLCMDVSYKWDPGNTATTSFTSLFAMPVGDSGFNLSSSGLAGEFSFYWDACGSAPPTGVPPTRNMCQIDIMSSLYPLYTSGTLGDVSLTIVSIDTSTSSPMDVTPEAEEKKDEPYFPSRQKKAPAPKLEYASGPGHFQSNSAPGYVTVQTPGA